MPRNETDDTVRGLPSRGQHQNGNVDLPAKLAEDLEPVHPGQHHIEDHDVAGRAFERMKSLLPGSGDVNFETLGTEILGEHRREALIVLDEQNLLRHLLAKSKKGEAAMRLPRPKR